MSADTILRSTVVALCLAFLLAPLGALAQATAEQKAYAAEQRQKREAAEAKREAAQKKNLERNAGQRRDTEIRQRQEEARHQDSQQRSQAELEQARQAQDRERRAAERGRWERHESEAARQQQALPGPAPAGTAGSLSASPGPPAAKIPPPITNTSVICIARPVCVAKGGQYNSCRSVQQSYRAAGAMQVGLQDIITRCRAANAPDPCGSDAQGTPGSAGFRYDFRGGCAEQCAQVARCTPSDRR